MIATHTGNLKAVRPSKRSRTLFCIWPNLDIYKAVYLKCPLVDKVANGVPLPEKVLLSAESWEALVNGLHIGMIPEDRHETWLRCGRSYTVKTVLFLASHFFCRERVNALSDALLSIEPYPSTMPLSREEIERVLTEIGGILPITGSSEAN